MIHRNTYINAPTVLLATWQTRRRADLFFAGQVSGVEGYVESAASGLAAGRNARASCSACAPGGAAHDRDWRAGVLRFSRRLAALRTVQHHVRIMPPVEASPRSKQARQIAASERALRDLDAWIQDQREDPTPADRS